MNKLEVNIDESFPHLSHAPIIEAAIDIRVSGNELLEENTLKSQIEPKLVNYQFLDSQREIQFHLQHVVDPKKSTSNPPVIQDLGWKGLRFRSEDGKQIVQFNKNGFVFSRLDPYQSWEALYSEASRLWKEYVVLVKPFMINRIGVRYINRFQLPLGEVRFEDYLNPSPEPPRYLDLPFMNFLHQDTLIVPDHPYAINIVRTVQPPTDPNAMAIILVLDIDAYTLSEFEFDNELLKRKLFEIRWLKNKAFFGSITDKAMKLFE